MLNIRIATNNDFASIWSIIKDVIATGDTYPYLPQMTQDEAYLLWMTPQTYVVEMNSQCVGTFYIKSNQPGLGAHIANAGYMVSLPERGKGIGHKMILHSLAEAKKLGYLAMQFNSVVSTNHASINLYQKIGFKNIGIVPQGFKHQKLGLVDTHIMYLSLYTEPDLNQKEYRK